MIALVFLKKNTVVTYDTDYIYFSEYNWISLEFSEFPLMCFNVCTVLCQLFNYEIYKTPSNKSALTN